MNTNAARQIPEGVIPGQQGALASPGYDPLAHLGQTRPFSGVTLRFAPDLGEGAWGTTRWVRCATAGELHRAIITLRPGLSSAEIRSTLAHELVHVERGYAGPEFAELDEAVVDLVAASRLIPVWELESLHESVAERGVADVAKTLHVDAGVIEAGLRLLSAVGAGQLSGPTGTGSQS